MTAALEGGEWSAARPGRTLLPGKIWYPFYRKLGGPQGRSGRAENLVPIGIRSRTVQPVVSRFIPTELHGPRPVTKAAATSCLPLQINDPLLVTLHFVSNLGPFHFPTSHISKSRTIGLSLLRPRFLLLESTHEDQVRPSKASDLLSRKLTITG